MSKLAPTEGVALPRIEFSFPAMHVCITGATENLMHPPILQLGRLVNTLAVRNIFEELRLMDGF